VVSSLDKKNLAAVGRLVIRTHIRIV